MDIKIRTYICFFVSLLLIFFIACSPDSIKVKPLAGFDFSPKENIVVSDTIKFLNMSENSNSYFWDFGDGDTSTLKDPTHVYERSGSFIVTLISTNEELIDTSSITVTILKMPEKKPVASFEYLPNKNIRIDGDVKFLNTSENSNSYFWDFGDGDTSTLKEPTHAYKSYGSYIITLISTNETLTDTISKTVTLSDVLTLNNSLPIDVDNDSIFDFEIKFIAGGNGGHFSYSNLKLYSYNDYYIITDTITLVWDEYINNIYKKTLIIPYKFNYGDTINTYNKYLQNNAYFYYNYQQVYGIKLLYDCWLEQYSKYVGFIRNKGNKSEIGWIKLSISNGLTAFFISCKIPITGNSIVIDK